MSTPQRRPVWLTEPQIDTICGLLHDDQHDLWEAFTADPEPDIRSLLARLAEPWAPWRWDGVGDGICCNRCSGYKPTTDLAHTRDLDWHDESCPWRQAREALAT